LKADYGNTYFIPRHRFTANTVYDLPVGKGKQFANNVPTVVDYVIGGWEASQLFAFQTGYFLTPYYNGTSVPDGLGDGLSAKQNIRSDGANLRPNCSGSAGVPNAGPAEWFNNSTGPYATFTLPSLGQYGNCGTGIVQGPGLWDSNIQLAKSVPLGEKVHLKFQAQMMNVFNHPNRGNPNLNLSSTPPTPGEDTGNFGQILNSTNAGIPALQPTVTSTNGERHIWLGMRLDF
jgi:hypothetical protein